ncbi:MAG: anaerobic ribonucleoside-triphosphate reductase activating protein [Lentisphaeria bacterium]
MSEGTYSAVYARMLQPTMVDYPGKMSALLFTRGCNFHCGYCHNPSLLAGGEKSYTWEELVLFCNEYRKQWVDAITISGGEPTLQPQLTQTLEFFRSRGFLLKVDSNGSSPEVLQRILPLVDYLAIDVKCSLGKYPALTGWLHPEALVSSIDLVKKGARDYEFRTTVVESFHADEEILAIAKLAQGAKRLIFQPFLPHPNLPEEAFRGLPRTRLSFLQHAVKLASPWVEKCFVRGES